MSERDAIVVPHLPKIEHHGSVFRDGWISSMICGKSGCGKTSLMAQLIPDISDAIRFICIATMVYRNPFHLAIVEWAKKTKRVCVINESPDKIREFVEGLYRRGFLMPGKQELLLVFDDFSIHNRTGSRPENLVVEAFTRWRNLGVNIVVVCQDASMVAPSCRNCTNMRILFNSASRSAIHTFSKDVIERVPDQNVYQDLIRYITSTPFTYILIQDSPLEVSVGSGRSVRRVMTDSSVDVPTYNDLMKEMGAGSPNDLCALSSAMQMRMGNTAHELKRGVDAMLDGSDSENESGDSSSDEGADIL